MKYYKSLDGLRAVAVFIVLIAHAGVPYPQSGGVGVDIFFVLSGFLITSILVNEYATIGTINFGHFYIKRFLRLAPCLILACAAYWLFFIFFAGPLPNKEVLLALTYTANWARALYQMDMKWLNHAWSLAIEEQFYLLWPLLILMLERRVREPHIKGLLLLALALGLALYRYAMVGIYNADRIYFGLDTHMDGLVLGAALCYLIQYMRSSAAWTGQVLKVYSLFVVPLAILGLLLLMYLITWTSPWMGRLGFFMAAFGAVVLLADLVIESPYSLLSKPLSTKMLVYIGRISYGLYLWHFLVFNAFDYFEVLLPEVLIIFIKLMLSLLVASMSYHLVEQRFLKMKRHFSSPASMIKHATVADRPA